MDPLLNMCSLRLFRPGVLQLLPTGCDQGLAVEAFGFYWAAAGYSTQERELSPISVCPGDSEEAPMSAPLAARAQ